LIKQKVHSLIIIRPWTLPSFPGHDS